MKDEPFKPELFNVGTTPNKEGMTKAMITVEEIRKIAGLAKFSLEDENLEELAAELGRIVEFANEVSGVDLSGLDLTEMDETVPLREDVVIPSQPVEKILLNARESHDGYFVARD